MNNHRITTQTLQTHANVSTCCQCTLRLEDCRGDGEPISGQTKKKEAGRGGRHKGAESAEASTLCITWGPQQQRPAQEMVNTHSGINLARIVGDERVDPGGFVGARGGCGEGTLTHRKRGPGGVRFPPYTGQFLVPSSGKKCTFHLKWRVLVNSERYFCPCPHQQNVKFSA